MGNSKYEVFAFEEMFDCLNSLYQEIAAKCSVDEKKEMKELKTALRKLVRELTYRTHQQNKKSGLGDEDREAFEEQERKRELTQTQLKYKVIDDLSDFEELVRENLDKHGFSTLNMESDEGDAYN